MTAANTDDKTRFNFIAPDVTIVYNRQEDRITWRTSDLLNSDHKAIIFELSYENYPVPGKARNRTRWNWDKAYCPGFALQLDQLLSSCPTEVLIGLTRKNRKKLQDQYWQLFLEDVDLYHRPGKA